MHGQNYAIQANVQSDTGSSDAYTTDGAIVIDRDLATSKVLMFHFDDSPQF